MDSKTHGNFQSTKHRLVPPKKFIRDVAGDDRATVDLIEALIEIRGEQRDAQIASLRRDLDRLIDQLRYTTHQLLLEELACFKDILALHGERDRNPEEPALSSTK